MPRTPLADYAYVLEKYIEKVDPPSSMIEDRAKAIASVASVAKSYSLLDLEQLCNRLIDEPVKCWPTPGQWVSLLKEQYDKRQSGKITGKGQSNLDGMTFDKIMASKQGQEAKRKGKPATFLEDVRSGKIPVSTLDFPRGTR